MEALIPIGLGAQTVTAFGKRSLTRAAGDIGAREAETEAKEIELGAIQREGDRKGRLVEALATQIASAGTKGISAFEGSPLKIIEADIEAEETATERDVFSARLAALTRRAQGKSQKSLLKRGADIGLVSDIVGAGFQATQAASVLGGKK
jgi:hypothetical protein